VHVPSGGIPVLYIISTMITQQCLEIMTRQCLAMSILPISSNVVPMLILPMAYSLGTMNTQQRQSYQCLAMLYQCQSYQWHTPLAQ
jgi:hypothetical protein